MTKIDLPPAAGWYPNPDGAGNRFWSGSAWTGSYQETEGSQPPPAPMDAEPTQSQGATEMPPPTGASWWRRRRGR